MSNKVKVPGGAFYAGDGLTVDPITRTVSGDVTTPDWNQNDATASDYIKNRTHYVESIYADYVLNMSGTVIEGLSMPEVGETMTVKINGVESAETVKEAESSTLGGSYKYIGNIDVDSLRTGGTGWLVVYEGRCVGFANPDTTISVKSSIVHKLDNKFVNYDGLVRTFDYYFKEYSIYKTLYDDNGNECLLYTCEKFILPEQYEQLFGYMNDIGFSYVGSVGLNACFIGGYIIRTVNNNVVIINKNSVLGKDTNEMEQIASEYGFTHTTNPKA